MMQAESVVSHKNQILRQFGAYFGRDGSHNDLIHECQSRVKFSKKRSELPPLYDDEQTRSCLNMEPSQWILVLGLFECFVANAIDRDCC